MTQPDADMERYLAPARASIERGAWDAELDASGLPSPAGPGSR